MSSHHAHKPNYTEHTEQDSHLQESNALKNSNNIVRLVGHIQSMIHQIVDNPHETVEALSRKQDILNSSLNELSALIITLSPTKQRRMLENLEKQYPDMWNTPCVVGFDQNGDPIEEVLTAKKFEQLPESQETVRDTSGTIIQDKVYIREMVLLELLAGITREDIVRAFHTTLYSYQSRQ